MPLYIDGTKMPNPSFNAISCSDEKVWSSNTGRSKSAYMNGSIVQVKKNKAAVLSALDSGGIGQAERRDQQCE